MTPIKLLKYLGGLLGAIFIGAIGSGVWEKFLSPFFAYLSNTTMDKLSMLSLDYSNSIYTKVAANFIINNNAKISSLNVIFTIFIICMLFLMHSMLERINNKNESLMLPLVTVTILLFFVLSVSTYESYINRIATKSHLNLEIIRPYLGEEKYLRLRSSFYQIKSKKDFDIFEEKIIIYSIENNLNLKKFSD